MKKLTKKLLKELAKTTPKTFDSATVEDKTQEYLAGIAQYILEEGDRLDPGEAIQNGALETCPCLWDEVDALLYWNASEAFEILKESDYQNVLIENRRNLAVELLVTKFRELLED
jgi:hypothetical protein